MLTWLLDETHFTIILVAFAALMLVVGREVPRRVPEMRGRRGLALQFSGVVALAFWGVHNGVLALFGFDTLVSFFTILGLGAALGWGAGRWIAADPREMTPAGTDVAPTDGDGPKPPEQTP